MTITARQALAPIHRIELLVDAERRHEMIGSYGLEVQEAIEEDLSAARRRVNRYIQKLRREE